MREGEETSFMVTLVLSVTTNERPRPSSISVKPRRSCGCENMNVSFKDTDWKENFQVDRVTFSFICIDSETYSRPTSLLYFRLDVTPTVHCIKYAATGTVLVVKQSWKNFSWIICFLQFVNTPSTYIVGDHWMLTVVRIVYMKNKFTGIISNSPNIWFITEVAR